MKKIIIISSAFFFTFALLFAFYSHREPVEIKVEYPYYNGTMKESKPLPIYYNTDRVLDI